MASGPSGWSWLGDRLVGAGVTVIPSGIHDLEAKPEWYPDPWGHGYRYWNGVNWTSRVQATIR
ncbi:MAG: hypothetical protein JWO37_2109 [Acidimicrobiales bacterium]|nr:hypothetical protein [Acidimicrobiales bacterium]